MLTESRVETNDKTEFTLVSEDGSRRSRRGRRLLPMMAFGFVFLALCLLLVDFRRLDLFDAHSEARGRHRVHDTRPIKLTAERHPRRG